MMSIELMESDPNVWSDQSFFNVDDNQIQHTCGITTKLGLGENESYGEEEGQFWDVFGLDFNNEHDLTVDVMNTEVESQTKEYELDSSYLNASTFMSPISISSSPTSPLSPELIEDDFEQQLNSSLSKMSEDLDNTSALEILEQILSVNSSDNEDSQQEYPINAEQYYTQTIEEIPLTIEPEFIVTEITTYKESDNRPKRQIKRKISEFDSQPKEKKSKKASKTPINKKERKKVQNRSAANRYRIKKREEVETTEVLQNEQNEINHKLKVQLEKLQMEFKVVYPLASMAFSANPKKNLLLQMLNIRVMKDNLLD